jgi:ketosteroid isomerase-like protein
MSRANVELVRQLQPGRDVDLAEAFRDDAIADALLAGLAPFVHPEFESMGRTSVLSVSGTGLQGLRAVWLDWLEPWESYRVELEDVIDAGDQTVVLVRDFGLRKGSDAEVSISAASVWTVRGGKIARVEFYTDRAEGLAAAGLPG